MKVLIMNGPNLNMLGKRDSSVYGDQSYDDLCNVLTNFCETAGIDCELFHSNHEGDLVDRIQRLDFDAVVINPGALTHYSYSLRDALEIFSGPKIEVHISNISAREAFRNKSVISPVCTGTIAGLGIKGYILAIEYLVLKSR
jgi:3-dehydroquinate dehydratase-2